MGKSKQEPAAQEEVVFLTACKAEPQAVPALQEMAAAAVKQEQLKPKYKSLTPDQIRAREAVKRNLEGLSVQDYGPVTSSANPYMHLFMEFQTGQISLLEMNLAIDSMVLQNKALFAEYEYKRLPTKPQELWEKENDFWATIAKYDKAKQNEMLRAFNDEARAGRFARYFYEADRIASENRASLWQLQEMLQRQLDRSPAYASRIRDAIMTHEAESNQ